MGKILRSSNRVSGGALRRWKWIPLTLTDNCTREGEADFVSNAANHCKNLALSFESDLALLDLVQEVSDSVCRYSGFDTDGQYWIGLAVREAVANAIQHGNKRERQKKVELVFGISDDRLRITVRDQGMGIDESKIPDPLDPENLLKPGGRGIFFVRSFMDKVTISARPEGGNEIIMEKLRGQNIQGEENDD